MTPDEARKIVAKYLPRELADALIVILDDVAGSSYVDSDAETPRSPSVPLIALSSKLSDIRRLIDEPPQEKDDEE